MQKIASKKNKTETQRKDRDLVVLATSGSVDDGKSTLIGRLLYDCNELYDDQLAKLQKDENGNINPEYLAHITDGLSDERAQGITIDVAYRHFSRPERKYIIADVPGHEQYTRNMITGVSKANIAMILIDARKGMQIQTKRHLFIAGLLETPHILIVVNKMDLVDYSEEKYKEIKKEVSEFLAKMNVRDLQFVPVSAYEGAMVVSRGDNLNWYGGPTLLSYLDNIQVSVDNNLIDFRLPIQMTIKISKDKRGSLGQIRGGVISVGDEVVILPSKKKTKISDIYVAGEKKDRAFNGQSVLVSFETEVDVSRGDVIVRPGNLPITSNEFEAMVSWFDDDKMEIGKSYIIKHGAKSTRSRIQDIKYKIDIETLHRINSDNLEINEIGRISLRANDLLNFDVYSKNKDGGSFIIIDEISNRTIGAGMIVSKGRESSGKKAQEKISKNKGALLWFTGLSGSGKTTIADKLNEKLIELGLQTERLDGDIVREGLSSDLGFSKEDRDKNLDRISFVSSLLEKHGVLVSATFVSPYKKKRDEIRKKHNNFIEIFVDTSLDECERRDVKGLYKKARAGNIENFTGISDKYEEPKNPEIVIKTEEMSVDESVEKILRYLGKNNFIS
jgi:bifunctional enzyme CysN/CysC